MLLNLKHSYQILQDALRAAGRFQIDETIIAWGQERAVDFITTCGMLAVRLQSDGTFDVLAASACDAVDTFAIFLPDDWHLVSRGGRWMLFHDQGDHDDIHEICGGGIAA
jgi:hypothetical protein